MRRTLAAALRLPGRWRAVLGGRGVLAVEGADSRKFLQGLTTADVSTLDDHGPLYSGACHMRAAHTGHASPERRERPRRHARREGPRPLRRVPHTRP